MKKRDCLIAVALLVSLLIYVFYRTERTVINEIIVSVVPLERYLELRESVRALIPLNKVVIYSLPEGLWVFCITLTSKTFYIQAWNRRMGADIVPLIYCIGLEISQLVNLTNGTFDLLDIDVSVLFWVAGRFTFEPGQRKRDLITQPDRQTLLFLASYGIVYLSHVAQ